MTRRLAEILTCTAVLLLIGAAWAQPPGRKGPPGARPQGGGPGGPQGEFRPPMMNPLMRALDADRNGEISAEEIKNAAAALKKLDKNDDGKLTRDELRPDVPPGFGGRGQGGLRGPGGPGGGRPGAGSMVDRLMNLDANGDGKVDAEELPERMQRILERGDTNGDEAIDREEAEKLAEQMRQRGGGRGAGRGGRPDGEPPAGKPRPKRPAE